MLALDAQRVAAAETAFRFLKPRQRVAVLQPVFPRISVADAIAVNVGASEWQLEPKAETKWRRLPTLIVKQRIAYPLEAVFHS